MTRDRRKKEKCEVEGCKGEYNSDTGCVFRGKKYCEKCFQSEMFDPEIEVYQLSIESHMISKEFAPFERAHDTLGRFAK